MKVAQQVASLANIAAFECGFFLFDVLPQLADRGFVHRLGRDQNQRHGT